ncbi:NYN domain-containing protein [Ruegeria atlantica]|uniref:NYN domain-containing protein n=1 Tax=Ruegeria atlantica TaxID=81569 RepID=UPI00249569D7|nr:NYN domain-containing protein [Ruegeria atlantica]
MTLRVAILVDGDNISATYKKYVGRIAQKYGRIDVARVYMNAQVSSAWHEASEYHLIHSGTGKNASDILLCIDAIEFALNRGIDAMVIVSSDGDFTHLHRRLREFGVRTVGVGEAKAPQHVRDNCTVFVELQQSRASEASDLDRKIQTVISQGSQNGQGIPIADLNVRMRRLHDIKISTYPEKNWRGYLTARDDLFELDPKGPAARVRFKPQGFG